MQRIIVASENPVKISAAQEGFSLMFPETAFEFSGADIASGVHHQPIGEAETLRGAMNRTAECARIHSDADYYVGIEGGVDISDSEICAFAWIVIRSSEGKIGKGRSGTFLLPAVIADLVRTGMEFGDASAKVFEKSDLKRKNGSIGLLTGDIVTRTKYYLDPVVFALIPFKNPELYF